MNKIKAKVLTIARFNLMLKNSKEHADLLTQVRKSDDGKLPKDMLFKSRSEIKSYVDLFVHMRECDSENEKFPRKAHKRVSIKIIKQKA